MKEDKFSSVVVPDQESTEASHSSTEEDVQRHWQGVVKRRSFLKGLGIAGATLSAKVTDAVRLYAVYDGRFRSNFTSHTGTAGVEFRF